MIVGATMISKPTVLVLGAGASVPYGFPTGIKLAQWACRECEAVRLKDGRFNDTKFSRAVFGGFPRRGLGHDLLSDFGSVFRDSACTSLDAFVETTGNHRFLPLVKAAIITRLVQCERDDRLFPDADGHELPNADSDWCAYLLREFLKTTDEAGFVNNELKVVTFNFDRSFERKLFRMIKSAYGVSGAVAVQLRATIPVLHMHGSLGSEAWCGSETPESREYISTATEAQQGALFDRIHLVHEEISQEDRERAHEWLTAAHTICFLGFGFHRINIGRLRMNEPHRNATVWGTALGLSGPELTRARGRLWPEQAMNGFDPSMDAFRLLRECDVIPNVSA
jgi:hypothetical protein